MSRSSRSFGPPGRGHALADHRRVAEVRVAVEVRRGLLRRLARARELGQRNGRRRGAGRGQELLRVRGNLDMTKSQCRRTSTVRPARRRLESRPWDEVHDRSAAGATTASARRKSATSASLAVAAPRSRRERRQRDPLLRHRPRPVDRLLHAPAFTRPAGRLRRGRERAVGVLRARRAARTSCSPGISAAAARPARGVRLELAAEELERRSKASRRAASAANRTDTLRDRGVRPRRSRRAFDPRSVRRGR